MASESVHTYPATNPSRITTSAARACTQPTSAGFMRRRPVDDFDDQPEKKLTQEEQDEEDEKARKRAMKHLISSWQERLQLLSVITTFFATTEASMLVNTKPASGDFENLILRASNSTFLGALILHVCASVLAFLGAFLLISYKLREAKREEMIVEGLAQADSPLGESAINDAEKGLQRTSTHGSTHSTMCQRNGLDPAIPPVFSTNPHIEQVSPCKTKLTPDQLLRRTHAICVLLSAVGFVLAIVGILCYAWALQPRPVSIFATVCLGGALLSMIALRV